MPMVRGLESLNPLWPPLFIEVSEMRPPPPEVRSAWLHCQGDVQIMVPMMLHTIPKTADQPVKSGIYVCSYCINLR